MEKAYIGVGGNLGDVMESFRRARDLLSEQGGISSLSSSRVFSTSPVGQNAGTGYLNAAFEIATSLGPLDLLDVLIQVEQAMQRKRHVHWGPRTIDLDLVFYGERLIQEARLNVPHPAAWYRRFVLDPVADLNSNVYHPTKEMTVTDLKQMLSRRPLRWLLLANDERIGTNLSEHLSDEFSGLIDITWRRIDEPGEMSSFEFIAWNIEQKLKVREGGIRFDDLPITSRLDVSLLTGDAYTAITDVIKAATDEPVIVGAL